MSIQLKYGATLSGKQHRVIHTSAIQNQILITGNLDPAIDLGFSLGEPILRWGNCYVENIDITNETFTINGNLVVLNPDTLIDHTSVSINSGIGLTGGGDLTTTRTIAMDIPSLTVKVTPVPASDYVAIYDAAGATHKKVLVSALTGGGENNTASNVGVGGVGVFKQKTGVNLEFKNINTSSSMITVFNDTGNSEIDIDVVPGQIDHDALLNYVANEHINHSTVSVTGGLGLSGGGAITSSSSIDLDIPSLTLKVTPVPASDYIVIYDTAGMTHKKALINSISGEVNTASNVGVGGVGVFKQKTGVNLEFKNINAASTKVTVVNDPTNNEVDIDIVPGQINHNSLLNYVANEHIDHSTISISAGIGLTGGGFITTSQTIAMDIPSLTVKAVPAPAADYVAIYDTAGVTHKKALVNTLGEINTASNVGTGGIGVFKQKTGANLEFKNINAASTKVTVVNDAPNNEIDIDIVPGQIDHDALLNFVANKHIDHSTVSISSGIGLTGGGNITTTRTLSVDINGLTADPTPDGATDYVMTYDASATTLKKVLLNNLPVTATITNSTASATAVTSTTSLTYVLMDSMTLTPAAGTYYVTFSSSGHGDTNNADNFFAMHIDTTIISHTARIIGETSGAQANAYAVPCHTHAVVTLNGSQAINVRYRTTAGTITMYERSLIILKVG